LSETAGPSAAAGLQTRLADPDPFPASASSAIAAFHYIL